MGQPISISTGPDDGQEVQDAAPNLNDQLTLGGFDEVEAAITGLKDTAQENQTTESAKVQTNIAKVAQSLLDNTPNKEGIVAVIRARLAALGVRIAVDPNFTVSSVTMPKPPALENADGQEIDPAQIQALESIDVSPGDNRDVIKAVSSMSGAEIQEIVGAASGLLNALKISGITTLIRIYNEPDGSKQLEMMDAFKKTDGGKAVKSLLDKPVFKKFFKEMDSPAPAGGAEDMLGGIAESMGPMLEKFMAMFKKFQLMFEDFQAMMDGKPRLTDSGIDDDIAKGQHLDVHKKNTLKRWKQVKTRLKDIGDQNSGLIQKANADLGDPLIDPKRKEYLTQSIKSMKEEKTDLTKEKKKLDDRLKRLNVDPKAEEAREAAENQAEITSAISEINDMPMNDLVKADPYTPNGATKPTEVRIKRLSGDENKIDDLFAKLKAALPATDDRGGSLYIKNVTPAGASLAASLIRTAAMENLDKSTTISDHLKKGLRGALEANGDWFGPVENSTTAGEFYDYVKSPDGNVYAQRTDGSKTWRINKNGTYTALDGQYVNGSSKTPQARPTGNVAYNTETRTFGERTGAANEAKETPDQKKTRYITALAKSFELHGGASLDIPEGASWSKIADILVVALEGELFDNNRTSVEIHGGVLEATDTAGSWGGDKNLIDNWDATLRSDPVKAVEQFMAIKTDILDTYSKTGLGGIQADLAKLDT